MNDKNLFNGDSSKTSYNNFLFDSKSEARTRKNLEAIESLFGEWDDEDKNNTGEFNLDSQVNSNFDFNDSPAIQDSSFDSEPSLYTPSDDPLEKTMEIKDVNLQEMKELQAKLHELYDEPVEEKTASEGQSQNKGKSLVKATKQGIAFSNGSMTRTFLDCVVLCFITASMGYGMFMYIMTHI